MTRLDDALRGVQQLAFDSSPVIYYVEAEPTHGPLIADVFQRIGRAELEGTTSVITVAEVLTKPLATGDNQLEQTYRDLLLDSDRLRVVPITQSVAELAADLRARHGIRTPDALQIAVALAEGCEAFLTNDLRLRRVVELPILLVDDLEL